VALVCLLSSLVVDSKTAHSVTNLMWYLVSFNALLHVVINCHRRKAEKGTHTEKNIVSSWLDNEDKRWWWNIRLYTE
jgi:hypothetical protein